MSHAFNDGKSRYDFVEGRLTTDSGETNSYFESYSGPVMWNENKTQIRAHLDTIQVRLSITSLPTSGTIGKVAEPYRPGIPALLNIVRDSAPYESVGTAFLGADGTLSYYTKTAGNVQIYGCYSVADHD